MLYFQLIFCLSSNQWLLNYSMKISCAPKFFFSFQIKVSVENKVISNVVQCYISDCFSLFNYLKQIKKSLLTGVFFYSLVIRRWSPKWLSVCVCVSLCVCISLFIDTSKSSTEQIKTWYEVQSVGSCFRFEPLWLSMHKWKRKKIGEQWKWEQNIWRC